MIIYMSFITTIGRNRFFKLKNAGSLKKYGRKSVHEVILRLALEKSLFQGSLDYSPHDEWGFTKYSIDCNYTLRLELYLKLEI